MNAPHIRDARADELASLASWLPGAASAASPGERVLLALDDSGAVLAGLCVVRSIPMQPLRHWLHVGWRVRACAELGLGRRDCLLQLGQDHVGAAELSGFAHAPGLDGPAVRSCADALVAAALAWLRKGPAAEPARVIARVAGRRDGDGGSPFWRGLGARLCGAASHAALARWPRHPVEAALLEAITRAAIGAVDPAAEAWRAALHAAGLRAGQHVDPLDGGPVYEAPLDWAED